MYKITRVDLSNFNQESVKDNNLCRQKFYDQYQRY